MTDSRIVIGGLEDMRAKFQLVTRTLRTRVLRLALSAGARVLRDIAKREAPVLKATRVKSPYRQPGTLKQAIRVRSSKRDRAAGDVGVFVNVKPLPRGSAKNPRDPYYWRWQEFGWTPAAGKHGAAGTRARRASVKSGATPRVPGKFFLRAAALRVAEALPLVERALVKWLTKIDAQGRVTP
jgi:HK97 gp10 family phage protein